MKGKMISNWRGKIAMVYFNAPEIELNNAYKEDSFFLLYMMMQYFIVNFFPYVFEIERDMKF